MKQNGGSQLSHELKDLAEQAEALVGGGGGEDAQEKAKEIRDRLAAAVEAIQETFGVVEERAGEGLKQVDKSIRENPYPALAIALGVGVVAGLLLKRNK
ncbi:MAG: hypothetical protein JWO95_2432 [Verrucomicrobiales bacterium]|nr:hypothetical protein [Verrucomicrobiales bacterium]